MLPCGTPVKTFLLLDVIDPIRVHWFLFVKYDLIHFITLFPIFISFNFSVNNSWFTVSNAFLKSTYNAIVCKLLF